MTLFRGPGFRLGACWNRLVETVKTRKKREKTEKKWARNGLKKVGPMTDSWETHGRALHRRGQNRLVLAAICLLLAANVMSYRR